MSSENPILSFPLEVRLWLDSKCREPLTNSQIREVLLQTYPWIPEINVQAIRAYRDKYVPEYKNILMEKYGKEREKKPEELEEEILKEVEELEREAKEEEEFVSEDEKRKMNILKAHRKLLKEAWLTYVKAKKTFNTVAMARFIEICQKELEDIQKLEVAEKSLLSALDEVRKSSEKETIEQKFDSLVGWSLLRLIEKAKTYMEAQEYIFRLQLYLNSLNYKLLTLPSIKDVVSETLKELYVQKEMKK